MKVARNLLQHRLGQVIRRHREAKKWTQEGFADHIEMHRAAYGFVEQGRRDVRLTTLERVANGLEEPMWVILRETEES